MRSGSCMDSWTYDAYDFMEIINARLVKDEALGKFADSTLSQIDLFLTPMYQMHCQVTGLEWKSMQHFMHYIK